MKKKLCQYKDVCLVRQNSISEYAQSRCTNNKVYGNLNPLEYDINMETKLYQYKDVCLVSTPRADTYVYIYNNVLGSTSSTHLPMQWVPLSASTAFSNFPFLMGRIWHNFSLNNIKLPSTQCTQEAQKVQDKYGEVPMMELDEHWWDGILQ